MEDIADTVADITTDVDDGFAIPVIFSAPGEPVVTKTVGAVVTIHGLAVDENGIATTSLTSRIMVSELALKDAGFPVRNGNGKLTMKDRTVQFVDARTETLLNFVIREAFDNRMTGLISCTLGRGTTV
jgi:hypothetical protein